VTTLAGRNYARALFDLACEGGEMDAVEQDLRAARAALFDQVEVRAFLANRLIGRTMKKRMVRAAFEGAVDGRVLILLFLLADRGRTRLLGEISEEFERLSRLARGVRKVTLTTAFSLGEEEIRAVTLALEARLQARVELAVEVRPSLIGGVRAASEGREIEFSIEGRLRDLFSRLGASRTERQEQR
jgi:F-type H+-transporting ATPase subunit delta